MKKILWNLIVVVLLFCIAETVDAQSQSEVTKVTNILDVQCVKKALPIKCYTVKVKDFTEAYTLYCRMVEIQQVKKAGNTYNYTLPNNGGNILFYVLNHSQEVAMLEVILTGSREHSRVIFSTNAGR